MVSKHPPTHATITSKMLHVRSEAHGDLVHDPQWVSFEMLDLRTKMLLKVIVETTH